ncbi:hypothetical protein C1646_749485 [Rhizophagus diaphanus]|nr:hypothetical protein C1646_749485 [Rhizophagus diaphanus] [Rhizophagus sp. MUCL 43196]
MQDTDTDKDKGDNDKNFNNKDDDYNDKDSDVDNENYEEDDDNGDYDKESDNDNKKYEEVDIIEEIKIQLVEFISEYQKVTLIGKKMSVIVVVIVKNNVTEKKNRKHKKHSDDNIKSSFEEIEIQTKKKKKSYLLRENGLSKEKKRRSEVIADLVEILQFWAHEIINKGTNYDILPLYLVFDMKSSVFINKNNSAMQMQNSQTSNTSTPIFIQLPSQVYQNLTNTHLELPSSSKLPSISEFLNNLDLKYNCNNVYAKFKDAFLEEELQLML